MNSDGYVFWMVMFIATGIALVVAMFWLELRRR